MNKFTLLVLLSCTFFIPNMTFSQDYCPFDFENGLWEASFYQAGGPEYIYRSAYNDYAVGDTLVNDSTLCYKLRRTGGDCGPADEFSCFDESEYTPFSRELGLICEQDKRIYYNGNLLYDFNVEIGDTIDHWWGIEAAGYGPPTIISVDSIEMCGKVRKRLQASFFTLGITYFIEGVGSNSGLIPSYEYFESGSYLVCYSDENCTPCSLRYCNGEVVLGSPCDDGNPNTVNDVYQPDCSCAGVLCNNTFILEFPANH